MMVFCAVLCNGSGQTLEKQSALKAGGAVASVGCAAASSACYFRCSLRCSG